LAYLAWDSHCRYGSQDFAVFLPLLLLAWRFSGDQPLYPMRSI